jgi:class 3 adenylate cyclase
MMNKKEVYPQGQVTFLFTDLVGSTQLWEVFPEAMHASVARHDALLKQVISSHQGRIVKKTGDGIHAAFASPIDAIYAAIEGQKRVLLEEWGKQALYSCAWGCTSATPNSGKVTITDRL